MDQARIGAFIATLRKEKSMTQKEMAQRLGVSDKTVSKWETGRGMPDISIIPSLCKTLEVSVNELLSGDRLDVSSYQEKAEENIQALMQRRSYKKMVIHIAVSAIPFLISFLCFPLAAGKVLPPIMIPISLFWSILLIVGNSMAGITYGIAAKWGKMRLLCMGVYNVFLLIILITVFAIAAVVFSVA